MNKIKQLFKRYEKWLIVSEIKLVLLRLYLSILVLGIFLVFLYAIFPGMNICFTFFKEEFCTTWGAFLILIFSVPGYFISGNILAFFPSVPWFMSFLIVITVSGAFFYYLGYLIDLYKEKKLNTELISKIIIYTSIFILLIILLSSFLQ